MNDLDEVLEQLVAQHGLEKVLDNLVTACLYHIDTALCEDDPEAARRWERNSCHVMNCREAVKREDMR